MRPWRRAHGLVRRLPLRPPHSRRHAASWLASCAYFVGRRRRGSYPCCLEADTTRRCPALTLAHGSQEAHRVASTPRRAAKAPAIIRLERPAVSPGIARYRAVSLETRQGVLPALWNLEQTAQSRTARRPRAAA